MLVKMKFFVFQLLLSYIVSLFMWGIDKVHSFIYEVVSNWHFLILCVGIILLLVLPSDDGKEKNKRSDMVVAIAIIAFFAFVIYWVYNRWGGFWNDLSRSDKGRFKVLIAIEIVSNIFYLLVNANSNRSLDK